MFHVEHLRMGISAPMSRRLDLRTSSQRLVGKFIGQTASAAMRHLASRPHVSLDPALASTLQGNQPIPSILRCRCRRRRFPEIQRREQAGFSSCLGAQRQSAFERLNHSSMLLKTVYKSKARWWW
jgi:hypothetical protein